MTLFFFLFQVLVSICLFLNATTLQRATVTYHRPVSHPLRLLLKRKNTSSSFRQIALNVFALKPKSFLLLSLHRGFLLLLLHRILQIVSTYPVVSQQNYFYWSLFFWRFICLFCYFFAVAGCGEQSANGDYTSERSTFCSSPFHSSPVVPPVQPPLYHIVVPPTYKIELLHLETDPPFPAGPQYHSKSQLILKYFFLLLLFYLDACFVQWSRVVLAERLRLFLPSLLDSPRSRLDL